MNDDPGIQSDTGPFAIVPEWVLYAPVSDRAIRLYAVLARYADKDDGTCYPSRGLLADRMGCHAGSITRARAELVGIGALYVQERWKEAKHGKKPEQDSTLVTVLRVPPRVAARTPASPCNSELEPVELEPLNEKNSRVLDETFARFWAFYPRKIGKRAALKAWGKASKRENGLTIAVAAGAYSEFVGRSGTEQKFIPHPATWLNRDGWDDDLSTENQPRMPRGADATMRSMEAMRNGR